MFLEKVYIISQFILIIYISLKGTSDKESVQPEDSVSPTEQLSPEHLHSCESSVSLEDSQPPVEEFCNLNQESGVLAISNDSDPVLQPDTEEIHFPSEVRSVTDSDLHSKMICAKDSEHYKYLNESETIRIFV